MKPAAGYAFSTMQEIRSHSSVLYNERMAILFYLLDMKSIELHQDIQNRDMMFAVHSLIRQIYKNVRMLIRNNPTMRATLNLETREAGVYITDVADSTIEQMLLYCENNGYTQRRCHIIVKELDDFEMMIKDALQYYNYFIRPDFRQKPDIMVATQKYKTMTDSMTIEQLKGVVGQRHKIDFENLTTVESEEEALRIMDESKDDDEPDLDDEDDEDIEVDGIKD